MTDVRIVLCEACGSEGRFYVDTFMRDRNGEAIMADELCPYCEGTGGEIITVQPIELEDLDAIAGEIVDVS
jgi:hypothetical protein